MAFNLVWGAAAALCVSGRGALLLLIIVPLTQLFSAAVYSLWKWGDLTHEKAACTVTAVAFGGALWRCLSAVSAQNAADLGPALPLCILFLLCGFSAETVPSWKDLVKGIAALLTVGCIRELLDAASVFGLPLPFAAVGNTFGRSGDGSLGIGGILIAAAVVWVFGFSFPLRPLVPPKKGDLLFVALFTAAAGTLLSLFPYLSAVWVFFAVMTAGLILQIVCSHPLSPWLSFLPATTVCLAPALNPLIAVGVGGAVLLIGLIAPCVMDRLGRAPLPRRFSGAPLLLTGIALVLAILTAI